MSKQTLINELTKEVNQAEELLAECIKSDESEAVRYSFLSAKRAYSHAIDLANYHIQDGKESIDINHIEILIMNVINDFTAFIKPSREANAFVFDMLKQKICFELQKYNLSGGWIKITDGGFDDGQEILITDGKEVWTDTIMFDCSDDDCYIYFDNGSDPEEVTHWQPKPEPPKE